MKASNGNSNADGNGNGRAAMFGPAGGSRQRQPRKAEIPTSSRSSRPGSRYVMITGGAGFIGTNVAAQLLGDGRDVLVYDNLSRPGVERNLRWLQETFGSRVRVQVADVRDPEPLRRAVSQASCVFHFAAQVAVTTSLVDPGSDFEINARGTLNVLEACRRLDNPPPLLFTSTNKVYGNLDDVRLVRAEEHYRPADASIASHGVSEEQPLDFHSPYGCSKGTADQYVLDYARSFELPATVFRMSCIYGPHQCGTEDQGWVAHFVRQALRDEPITFYGDGRQVRDLLFVEDLVRAMLGAVGHIEVTRGRAVNIGGGPDNARSLLELMDLISILHKRRPEVRMAPWRQGDQRYYVSDTRRFEDATGWHPQVDVRNGVERLYSWLRVNEAALAKASPVVA